MSGEFSKNVVVICGLLNNVVHRRMIEIQEEYKHVQERLDNKEQEAETLKESLTLTKQEKEAELIKYQVGIKQFHPFVTAH